MNSTDETKTPTLEQKARAAVDKWRDLSRAQGIGHLVRDPLVLAIHDALDELQTATDTIARLDKEREELCIAIDTLKSSLAAVEENYMRKSGDEDGKNMLRAKILDGTFTEHKLLLENAAHKDTIARLTREKEEAEAQLAALGDLAVADWDDKTVGAVDAVVKEPTKYKDRLRMLFVEIPKERDSLLARVSELERERDEAKCPTCGGSGEVDSGGILPWGAPISLPCPKCSRDQLTATLAARESELAEVRAERNQQRTESAKFRYLLADIGNGLGLTEFDYDKLAEVAANLRAELATAKQQRVAGENEILRLNGLLRVANTERNDAIASERTAKQQRDELDKYMTQGEAEVEALTADRDRLAAALTQARDAIQQSLYHHGCDPCHLTEALDSASAELAKHEEQQK